MAQSGGGRELAGDAPAGRPGRHLRIGAGSGERAAIAPVPDAKVWPILPGARRSLPAPLAGFVGREREVLAIVQLLREARLVTLTGAGGIGKTRLAQRVAAEVLPDFEDGVCWIDLVDLTDPELILTVIAQVLGVRGDSARPLHEMLPDLLGARQLFLVVDNCEHLLSGSASVIDTLLRAAPALSVLATSRQVLGLTGERNWPVPPLSLPEPEAGAAVGGSATPSGEVDRLLRSEAGRLFVQRAQAVRPSLELSEQSAASVAEICRRLDGIPLALELAAARLNVLSADQILARLDDRFGLLTGGARTAEPRHRTLAALLDWSHDLLGEDERRLFRRLAVFVGGWSLEAAERVCDEQPVAGSANDETGEQSASTASRLLPTRPLDLLAGLVDKSLVLAEEQGPPERRTVRYRMLETIREYALGQLVASGELAAMETRHGAFFLDLAERAEPELRGPERRIWLDQLERERENLRASERRASTLGDAETMLRLGAALWRFWQHANAADARAHLEAILPLAASMQPSPSRARALLGAGVLARLLGDFPAAQALVEESLAAARQLDDRWGIAAALYELGRLAGFQGRYADARGLLEESLTLFRELGLEPWIAATLNRLGYLAFTVGDLPAAREILEESFAIARCTSDRPVVAEVLVNRGLCAHFGGSLDVARTSYEEALAIYQRLADRQEVAMAIHLLGHVVAMQGDAGAARRLYSEGLMTAREAGNRRRLALVIWTVATLAATEGEPERAVRLEAAAQAAVAMIGTAVALPMRDLWRSQVAPARRALGERRVAELEIEGQAMALEAAVEETLTWLASPPGALPHACRTESRSGATRARPTSDEQSQAGGGRPRPVGGRPEREVLTGREREVAALIASGLSNRQIAERLVITGRTAGNHVQNILAKLGFRGRAQVAAWAVENGLGSPYEG